MVSSGVVTAIHVAGVRCGPCGAMRCNELHHKGHNATCYMYCCHNAGADHRDFKFSVLKIFKKFLHF